jgi:hypothetical protein
VQHSRRWRLRDAEWLSVSEVGAAGVFTRVCQGMSVTQSASELGVFRNTAWVWWRNAGSMTLRKGKARGLANPGDWSRPGGPRASTQWCGAHRDHERRDGGLSGLASKFVGGQAARGSAGPCWRTWAEARTPWPRSPKPSRGTGNWPRPATLRFWSASPASGWDDDRCT